MGRIDVRRLAAIDLYGSNGSHLRRTIIFVEFLLGAAGGIAIGLGVAFASSGAWQLLGLYVAAMCANYVPLVAHAASMLRDRDLALELEGTDTAREISRYTKRQAWLLVPLLFVVISIPQALGRRPGGA